MKMTMKNGLQFFSFLNLLRAFGLAITQRVAANLSVVGWSARDRQRGASALEYIVLAAAVIIIIGVLANTPTVRDAVREAFESLFDSAVDVSDNITP